MLERKSVLVTGASSGIGRAIALRCGEAGADLAITYRKNQEGAEATARELRAKGRRAEVLRVDISQEKEIDRLVDHLQRTFPRIDVWINNAGADILTGDAGRHSRLRSLIPSWRWMSGAPCWRHGPPWSMMRKQGGGSIINMAWDHVGQGMKGENPGIYSAAKGAVASFSRSLARDVAPDIRVNILAPGFIETAFGEDADPGFRQKVIEMTPLGRWGQPDDVAGAAVFLASDASSFLTGQMIMVNGGVVM